APSTVGINLCLGGGSLGLGPVPASTGNVASSRQPGRPRVNSTSTGARSLWRIGPLNATLPLPEPRGQQAGSGSWQPAALRPQAVAYFWPPIWRGWSQGADHSTIFLRAAILTSPCARPGG